LQRSREGEVTILDVRPEDEFALGHLPGAVNMPLRELEMRLAEFDPAQEIVAYCRGPYCVLSYEAVAVLRARGFKARRLQDGTSRGASTYHRSRERNGTSQNQLQSRELTTVDT
jgi:rhodanese-related sulfurtransferase